MSTAEKPRLPEVGEFVRSVGKLVEIQDVTPPPPGKVLDYVFERMTFEVEAFANRNFLEGFGTFTDFYGERTGEASAVKEAKELSVKYGPGVEMRVTKVTSRIRMRPSREQNFYDKRFASFDSLVNGSGRDLPDDVREVVWSSSKDC